MTKYETSVFPYYCKSSCMETERYKCYFELIPCKISRRDKCKKVEEIKYKKVSETREVLRNAIRKKLINHPLSPLLPIQSD